MYFTILPQFFELTTARVPDRVAVVANDMSITFAELRERVMAEAWAISEKLNHKIRQPIAVNLPKGLDCIIADLAILYSGNAYMNLDVKTPVARTNAILQKVKPVMVIGSTENLNCSGQGYELACATGISTHERQFILDNLANIIDTDLCCLINTSGSTGTPKTVALTHRSYIDYVKSVMTAGLIGEDAVAGSMAPSVFDHFSFELSLLMMAGCRIVPIPDMLPAFPLKLLEFIKENQVNFIFWVPTIMVNIANMDLLSKIDMTNLKTIWFAGEVFPTPKFNYWREKLPEASFVNLYGPTEITVDCLYYVAKNILPENEPVPVGQPLPNTDILLLNDDNKIVLPQEHGTEGELCVRGSSLAVGYYNNPEQTSQTFVQNPLNNSYPEIIYRTGDIMQWNAKGELIFLGRKDSMIKHSGYRIELGEIENAVFRSVKDILNTCAIYSLHTKKIILYYEALESMQDKDIKIKLGKYLPRYMIPAEFIWIREMPRNTNGKIDRRFLTDMYAEKLLK